MSSELAVREAFAKQAEWCPKLGSPFTGRLCEALAGLDRDTAVGRRVLGWQGQPDGLGDAVTLRLTGALHALVRRSEAPELAALYPPTPLPSKQMLWAAIRPVLEAHEAFIQSMLDSPPQTNEVGRAGPVMAGLLTIAAETGLPIALFELGASAGLNLNLDRFNYSLGGLEILGASGVNIEPRWNGPPPPKAGLEIVSRRGADIAPVDIADPAARERLIAYIWPDQPERLARTIAAIDLAMRMPPPLEAAEAADWTEAQLTAELHDGVARVLFHTVAFQYFPPDTQARIRKHLETLGRAASRSAPLAWLRYEADPQYENQCSLRLTLWPEGGERVLGVGHPHGTAFEFF